MLTGGGTPDERAESRGRRTAPRRAGDVGTDPGPGKRLNSVNERLEVLEGQNLADAVAGAVPDREEVGGEAGFPEVRGLGLVHVQPGTAGPSWELLLDWTMGTFRVRYPRSFTEMLGYGKSAVSCWHLHPDMVESLTGLMAAWNWAFLDPESGPLRVAEWLGRWLPDAVRQGQFILANCKVEPNGVDAYGRPDPYKGHKDPIGEQEDRPAGGSAAARPHAEDGRSSRLTYTRAEARTVGPGLCACVRQAPPARAALPVPEGPPHGLLDASGVVAVDVGPVVALNAVLCPHALPAHLRFVYG